MDIKLSRLIGSGAHKNAYSIQNEPEVVALVPKPGHSRNVRQEMKQLREIQNKTNNSAFLVFETENERTISSDLYLVPKATQDLTGYIEKNSSPISAQSCLTIMRSSLSGIAVLHEKNIVHGDLKHPNILMFETESKISDFGQARLFSSQDEIGVYLGDTLFQGPEGVSSQKGDVYAAGIIFADLLNAALVGDKQKLEDYLVQAKVNSQSRSVKSFLCDLVRFLLYYFFDKVQDCVSLRQETTKNYIADMKENLHTKVLNKELSHKDACIFLVLIKLTEDMLNTNAEQRPSAEQAGLRAQTVSQSIQKAAEERCNDLLNKTEISPEEEMEVKDLIELCLELNLLEAHKEDFPPSRE